MSEAPHNVSVWIQPIQRASGTKLSCGSVNSSTDVDADATIASPIEVA